MDQAEFIAASIQTLMRDLPASQKFQIIGHSVGCLTALLIEDQINSKKQLQNLLCLGSPLTKSPMQLTLGMENVFAKIVGK